MRGPILNTVELKRLPLARRPIARPGTILVFRMPDNQLVAPRPPYTTGETWGKGPELAYVVDSRPHSGGFSCRVPAGGESLFFDAAVRFTWRVSDPVDVVRERVEDPGAECESYLVANLPAITRDYAYDRPADAGREVTDRIGREAVPLPGRGIRIEAVHVTLTPSPPAPPARPGDGS